MKKLNLNSVLSTGIFVIICFLFLALRNEEPKINKSKSFKIGSANENSLILQSRNLDTNNISDWFTNNGSFNSDPVTRNPGFEWPRGSGNSTRYTSGLWMGCVVGNDTLTAVAEYGFDYKPGYVDDNGNPQGQNDPLYRIYRIERGDTTTSDYQNWPVTQGAYVTSNGKPFFLGTQTMFYVFTDAYPHESGISSLSSLKAQILQTNWCYTNVGLQDVTFTEFRVINRSNSVWTNTYISFWTDDDIEAAVDDKVGCDTIRELGFTYDDGPNPAVGSKVLRSPVTFTGNNSDTVRYYQPPGSQNLRIRVGYKYTGMNIFNTYYNSPDTTFPQPVDPHNYIEVYRIISGYLRTGHAWVNPINNQITKKAFSGDPVSGTGWIMNDGSDRRYLQGFGPFNMNPNDTQSVIFAQVIARGSNNLESVEKLRDLSDYVQTIYNQNFQSVLSVNNISTKIPDEFKLYQNYPNPFNPVTVIRYSLTGNHFITLKVYDALGKEIAALINEKQNAGMYEVDFDGSSLPSGVYFYKLSADGFSETKSMVLLK